MLRFRSSLIVNFISGMKRRKVAQQGWALFMLGLVFSNCIQAGLAGRMQLSSADQNDLHQQYRQQQNQQQQQLQHQQYYVQVKECYTKWNVCQWKWRNDDGHRAPHFKRKVALLLFLRLLGWQEMWLQADFKKMPLLVIFPFRDYLQFVCKIGKL